MDMIKMLVPSSKYGIKCPYTMEPKGYVVHNTYNDAKAKNEASYMIGNDNYTSFHYVIDDECVIQCIPDNRNAWHCGATYGNRNLIGLEICYSRSGGERFTKAELNAAKFLAIKLKERGWGVDKLFTHQQMSGKYCPHRTLDLGWERFKQLVAAQMGQDVIVTAPPELDGLKIDGSWGQATTRKAQVVFGTLADGIVSRQSASNKGHHPACHESSWEYGAGGSLLICAMQSKLGVKRDGHFGPITIKALQTMLGVSADGYCGPITVRALQSWLNRQ